MGYGTTTDRPFKNDIDALNNLGYTLFKAKKYQDALNYFDQALELDAQHKLAVTNKLSLLKKLEEIGISLGTRSKQHSG